MDLLYIDIIPSELVEIIVSYVELPDLDNLVNLVTIPINWSTIYFYHFGEYKRINYMEYKLKLSSTEYETINTYKCRFCPGNNINIQVKQSRRYDEAPTLLVSCLNCGRITKIAS